MDSRFTIAIFALSDHHSGESGGGRCATNELEKTDSVFYLTWEES